MTHARAPGPQPTPEPEIDFTPVPCRRRDGWTAERQRGFIRQLARIGLVDAAAKAVGMGRQSAYRLRTRAGAEEFAEAWDIALAMGQDNVTDLAIERAVEGFDVPYFYGGRQCGATRRYDNRLLIAALARMDRRVERRAQD